MKRYVVLILSLVMLFSTSACGGAKTTKSKLSPELTEKLEANAHTPVHSEISFRSFMWYERLSTIQEYFAGNNKSSEDSFLGKDTEISVHQYNSFYSIPEITTIKDLSQDDSKNYDKITHQIPFISLSLLRNIGVAGYSASMKMFFLYPVVDGMVIQEDSYAELIEALYTIELQSTTSVYEKSYEAYKDLCEKLELVYGKPVFTDHETEWIQVNDPFILRNQIGVIKKAQAVWQADDGSMLHFSMEPSVSGKYKEYTIELHYYAPDVYERFSECWQAIQDASQKNEEAKVTAPPNTNGL